MPDVLGPDRLAELEEERRFLLRSLGDLDRELAAGDVEQDDYETLRDDYTARAAAVLRALEEQRAARTVVPRRSRRSLALTVVAVLVVAVGVGVLVARSSGQRLPGQELTGGQGGQAAPDDVSSLLVEARSSLGIADYRRSADLYGAVLEADPEQPEALAYSGWLTVLVSREASDDVAAQGLEGGKQRIRESIAADPDYADPHCFLAIIAQQYEDDVRTARREADRCLALDPPAQMRGLVRQFVDGLD